MKLLTLISATAASATAFAGEPAPVPAPAPAPALGGWFMGATYGQFDSDSLVQGYRNIPDLESFQDFEFDMYTLHVGRDLDMQFLGCDLAAYLEIAYLDGDAGWSAFDSQMFLQFLNYDLDIIPITLNLKAERTLFAGIKGYATAGIGYAFVDTRTSFPDGDGSESDGGFYAQASLGLAYDINDNWEIYGGARWLYFEEVGIIGSDDLDLDDGIAYEIGLRYHF